MSRRTRVKEAFARAGEIIQFSGGALRELPGTRRYATEVIHQTAVLILGSALIIWVMEGLIGTVCGTEGSYTLKQFGAPLHSGAFSAWCGVRELAPLVWGYIFAAKVGCGYVAELGSMRISEKIDALEVKGIKPRTYLVGTRLVASWLAIPLLFTVGLAVMYGAEYLVTVVNLGNVSSGGYLYTFWLYQNPSDFVYSLIKAMAMGTAIVLVAGYYGFTARGGSVGVGRATAKSILINIVLVHVIDAAGAQLFWGLTPNAPAAN
jgi:phospholipid/cholesterol/gamma-HCH transport system permease protein